VLRLSFARADAGHRFDIVVNGQRIAEVELPASEAQDVYARDYALPTVPAQGPDGSLEVKFVAKPGSVAGGLFGLRLMR
jgi:hypothetical protein